MEIRDHLTRIWYPNNSLWNHFLLPELVAGKQTTLWKVNRMYFVFLIWLLILHVLRQFRPTIQKVSVRFCRRAGNSGNENSCFSDLTLWCPMHEIRIKKGKVLVSIYPPSWIGTLWFCWPDFDSWKPNLGETESLDRNMEPITSDILELLQKDSTKYVRCRELLQRVFILSISYFWQMAPLQSKCWNRKILVIPATTQNFAQPLLPSSCLDRSLCKFTSYMTQFSELPCSSFIFIRWSHSNLKSLKGFIGTDRSLLSFVALFKFLGFSLSQFFVNICQ